MPSPAFWFLSALALASGAHAAWFVEARPLEKAPYGRVVAPLVVVRTELAHLEGAGLELHQGQNELFSLQLPAGPRRELELQLAYLTTGTPRAAPCAVTLEVSGVKSKRELPLRSLDPASETFAALGSAWDYLAPAVRIPIAAGPLHVAADVPARCAAGRLLLLDPKIWAERPGPARRFVILVADSLSADWFEEGRDFMPFLRRWLTTFSTQVWSAGSNTHDTTNIVTRMQFRLRGQANGTAEDDAVVRPASDDPAHGLVPSFLNSGYDVVTFNSNLILSTAFAPSGFRSLYSINVDGSPNNQRSAEITVAQTKEWFARHPEHDALAFLWFDATHVHGAAPSVRPGLDLSRLPYANEAAAQQARAMSYVDLAIESLAASPQVAQSDVIFFADHGINFRTLEHPEPLWGDCGHVSAAANWHLEPVELRIPVGVRMASMTAPKVQSGLLDWIATAVRRHDSSIDTRAWEGRDLETLTAESPVLSAGHGGRATMFAGGRQLLFSSRSCAPEGGAGFFAPGGGTPGDRDVLTLAGELSRRSLLAWRRSELQLLDGNAACSVDADLASATDAQGRRLTHLHFETGGWFASAAVYQPEILGWSRLAGIGLRTSRAGCLEADVGGIRRPVSGGFTFAGSGLSALRGLPAGRFVPGDTAALRLELAPGRFVLRNGAMEEQQQERESKQLSSELRAAMKRWGYIQDDAAE